MTYRTSTLNTFEPQGFDRKSEGLGEEAMVEEIQAHIDSYTAVGWKLHSFTSTPGAFIKSTGGYTHRHYFIWEGGD